MSERSLHASGSVVAKDLDAHLAQFVATLARAGYSERTQYYKRLFIAPFIRWARDARLSIARLDEESVRAFLARPSRRRVKHGNPERATLLQFLEHLRTVRVAPPCPSSELSTGEVLVRSYLDHLRDGRGLCRRSIEAYSPFVRAFVSAQRLPEDIATLDAAAVRGHLLEYSRGRSVSFVRLLTAALRSFLRFAFHAGATVSDLATAVPPVRRWRLGGIPPFLTAEEVEQVIAATDRTTADGCRTLAILLLLARLGLRAGEVVALELDDIRWDVGEIVVRGKGRIVHRLPLLHDIGEALAVYLREARGPSSSRRVFLRHLAPHVGLSGPSAVGVVARDALRRAGLQPAGRVGAHIFRHSLATRMIRHGASLGEISEVLRHRSVESTQIYTKVEFEALRGVALPWPSPEAQR